MKSRNVLIVTLSIILLAGIGVFGYFLFRGVPGTSNTTNGSSDNGSGGFSPFDRDPSGVQTPTGNPDTQPSQSTATSTSPTANIPTLRLLSTTPVGGYGASTTPTTTLMRWIDRGRGNIYQAEGNSLEIVTLSNTVVPKMYASVWNKNLSSFIGSIFNEDGDISTLFSQLSKRASTTAASGVTLTPYELKGKKFPDNIVTYAVSPKKDRVFMLVNENGAGAGYISTFDGRAPTLIFTTPLTQATADWPEENTIIIATKASASHNGYAYSVNPQTKVWKKLLGPLPGLALKVSHDAKYAVVSTTGNGGMTLTSLLTLASGSSTDAVIRTIAEKCVWGNFYKNMLYCAVPAQKTPGLYPDDWYSGKSTSIDKIWSVQADTGEVHLVSTIVDQSDRIVDAFNLGLDDKDNYLLFMNKGDLSLWTLDLVR